MSDSPASGEPPLKISVLPVTPLQQNCSILWCTATKHCAVVDPGGEPERIVEAIGKLGLTPERILITHGHLDHAGATAALAEILNVPIEGPHEDDLFWIESIATQGQMWGMPEARPFETSRWLHQGDTVKIGNLTLDVIHCPGHTPGHVIFYHSPSRFAVVGDVIFQGSIGRTDFPRGNHGDLITSIREKLFPLGDDVTFLPGHGPLSTFGRERENNPYVSDAAVGVD